MTAQQQAGSVPARGPFSLEDDRAYTAWRDARLQARPGLSELLVPLVDPFSLTDAEKSAIESLLRRCNICIYKVTPGNGVDVADKSLVHRLGLQLGLRRLDDNLRADEDDITSLQVVEQQGNQYIPYTNRPLSWHADGYYNTLDRQVRGIILHCVRPAAEGGENALLDHELVYIRLRDENPDLIRALQHPGAMTIPPNIEEGTELRGARSGPVFSVDSASGSLHMRYSARKYNIEWRDDALTRQAAARITEILNDDEWVYRYRMNAGEGLICNNVLHRRSGFTDTEQQKRLMYRARYYDRVANTGLNDQA